MAVVGACTYLEACLPRRSVGRALSLLAASLAKAFRPVQARQQESIADREAQVAEETARRVLSIWGNSILRLSYSYVHNQTDAEEILQDVLVKRLQCGLVFANDKLEKSWLLTVAANLSKNRIKYNKLRTTDQLSDELIAQDEDDLSFVWDAVKSLPQNQREAIHLCYQEGYSTREIAEILGRNESTVRSDLARGRKKLGEILRESYEYGN